MAYQVLSVKEVDVKDARLYSSTFVLSRLGAQKKILVNEAKEKKAIIEIGFFDADNEFRSLTALTKAWSKDENKFVERSGSASDELRAATSKAALKAFEGRTVQFNATTRGYDWVD